MTNQPTVMTVEYEIMRDRIRQLHQSRKEVKSVSVFVDPETKKVYSVILYK